MATSGSAIVCESKTACCSGIDSAKGCRPAGILPGQTGTSAQGNGLTARWSSIRTVVAILLGVSGIAISTACMRASSAIENVVAAGGSATTQPKGEVPVILKCAECGVVESVRAVPTVGNAGSMMAADYDKALGKSTASYQVTVRMRDGSRRVFVDANTANWRPGERMTIIEGPIGAAN